MRIEIIKYTILVFFCMFTALTVKSQSNVIKAYYLQVEYQNNGYKDDSLFTLSEKLYLEGLNFDSLDYDTHYNLFTLYYNRAINISEYAKRANGNLPKSEEIKCTDLINELFAKALPHYRKWREVNKDVILPIGDP